jgi:hypothetical protein
MKPTVILGVLLTLLISPVFAAEEITFDYMFEGNIRHDFSSISKGPLRIGEFSDSRTVDNPNIITDSEGGFVADMPLADIVRDALVQGFTKGKAALVDADAGLTIQGTVLSSEATIVERDGVQSIQLTVRTSVQLRDANRTVWETILFGRGIAPVTEGMGQALKNAMDRTINGLVRDDYFLMEL